MLPSFYQDLEFSTIVQEKSGSQTDVSGTLSDLKIYSEKGITFTTQTRLKIKGIASDFDVVILLFNKNNDAAQSDYKATRQTVGTNTTIDSIALTNVSSEMVVFKFASSKVADLQLDFVNGVGIGGILILNKKFSFTQQFSDCDFKFKKGNKIMYKALGGAYKVSYGKKGYYKINFQTSNSEDVSNLEYLWDHTDGLFFSVFNFETLSEEIGLRKKDLFKVTMTSALSSKLVGKMIGLGAIFPLVLEEV